MTMLREIFLMKRYDTLITVASWEERFLLGTTALIKNHQPKKIYMYYYKEYADWSIENREAIHDLCNINNIECVEIEIEFENYISSWKKVLKINDTLSSNELVLIDISTMPRDVIWALFKNIGKYSSKYDYIYYKPKSYSNEWLSRDPECPRLQLYQSGIYTLGKPSLLIVTTGFDSNRTEQLINYFEPRLTLLGEQSGKQFNNQKRNFENHKELLESDLPIESFNVDAYSSDHGFEIINKYVTKHIDNYNILLSSLGPKLTSVALYNIWKNDDRVSLVYAPSREFNKDYSSGIGDHYYGSIQS